MNSMSIGTKSALKVRGKYPTLEEAPFPSELLVSLHWGACS